MKLTNIYARLEPDREEIRYIGKANDPRRRLREHTARAACRNDHCSNWLKSLEARGLTPRTEIIAEVPVNEWELWEKYFIKYFRALGFDLTNARSGGEGGCASGAGNHNFGKPMSEEQKQKISASLTGRIGKKHSLGTREKMSAAKQGHPVSEETRAKIRLANIGKITPLVVREKQSAATRGIPKSQEHRAKIGAARLGKKYGPYRAAQ